MRRWLELFRRPDGRAARHPRTLEIVFALSGHPSRTLRVNLETLKKAMMAAGFAIFAWFSVTFYIAYSHVANMEAIARTGAQSERIAALKASNAKLAEEREKMGQHLVNLQQRVEQLAEKVHGVVQHTRDRYPVERDQRASMGGPAIPVDENNASALMQDEIAQMDERLASLLPRLESTLERETARPLGVPLEGPVQISSGFGIRANPFGRGRELHAGMDFPGDSGTPVMATAPGKVDHAGQGGALGNYVAIDHGYGYRSLYGHLSRILVKSGDTIDKGQIVGLLGSTGRSSGPHLHYALQYHGRTINPAPYVEQ
jgi:murein DD-endopeptidase MepM/ murein hydrolase activator NlpD